MRGREGPDGAHAGSLRSEDALKTYRYVMAAPGAPNPCSVKWNPSTLHGASIVTVLFMVGFPWFYPFGVQRAQLYLLWESTSR